MRVLKTAPGEVLDVAFSPDCRAVAAAVRDCGLFLWNLDSPTIAAVRLEAGDYLAGGLRFSATGRQLRWQTFTGFRLYDRDTRTPSEVDAPPGALALSEDGGHALTNTGLPEYTLAGWRRAGGEWVRRWAISTRELSVLSLTPSPCGDRFAILTRTTEGGRWWENPMRLEVRDSATGAELSSGTYPYSYAARLAFSPRADQQAGIHGMTLLAWPLPAGGDPQRVQNDSRKHFTALAYHPGGRRLFATSNDETVHVFDARSLERVNRYTWQLDRLSAVAVSADGTLAAAGSAGGDVVVWDLE